TRRQFLTVGGVALAGAVLSRNVAAGIIKDVGASWSGGPSASPASSAAATPSATATATPTPTPAPTPATVTIPVPVYQQSMVLDCETAALQQGLAYYGINVSQADLFAAEYADTRLPVMGANHTVRFWGNPYSNFVGYVNGSDWTPTGFGVFWPVIQRLARAHGLPNAIGGEGFAPRRIYSELAAGHPVQVWIQTRFARVQLGTWTAWDGTQVRYSYAEHSVTLSGVSPTQVRVNDVLNASQYWVSKSLFEANFADFNNMAVIFQ
ncbi:MAG: hypothetical protein E6I60_13840, partial [Chloroflexi bacterium]